MREFLTSGKGILSLVFTILGAVFTPIGALVLVGALASQSAGAPGAVGAGVGAGGGIFLTVGLVLGAVGLWLGALRKAEIRKRARLRDHGVACEGTVVDVKQDFRVRVNRQYPWLVRYRYAAGGQEHENEERVMDLPPAIEKGAKVSIVYDAADPRQSALKNV